MNTQRPIKNKKTNKWEVWDFAYEEDSERYYEAHRFFSYKEAIDFWKIRNTKKDDFFIKSQHKKIVNLQNMLVSIN